MRDLSLEKLADHLRPERVDSPADLAELLSRFQTWVVRQPNLEPIHLSVEETDKGWIIRGWVCYPSMLEALRGLIEQVRLQPILVQVGLLPTVSVDPGSGEPVLFCASGKRASGMAAPEAGSQTAHIWEPGDRVRPLHRLGEHLLCQAESGYCAWVHGGDLALRTLPAEPSPAPDSAEFGPRITALASAFLGVRYVWGGSGPSGIDCSGLVQRVFSEAGLVLPRDSHEQMLGGRIVAAHDHRAPLCAGDLLFFTHADGRIGHVGISLGGWKVIHAEEPAVTTFSLCESDPDYSQDRTHHFVMAKRYLTGIDGRCP